LRLGLVVQVFPVSSLLGLLGGLRGGQLGLLDQLVLELGFLDWVELDPVALVAPTPVGTLPAEQADGQELDERLVVRRPHPVEEHD
jgi:hypothetical protein